MSRGARGLSILLSAVGAILAWAVDVESESLDVEMIGVILLIAGIVGALASIVVLAQARKQVVEKAVVEERD